MPSPATSSTSDGDADADAATEADASADANADAIDEAPKAVTPLGLGVRAVARFLWRRWVRVAWLTALLAGGLVWFSMWWMEIRPFGKQYPGPVYPAMAMVDGKPLWGAIDDTGRWRVAPRREAYWFDRWTLLLTKPDHSFKLAAKWPYFARKDFRIIDFLNTNRLRGPPDQSNSAQNFTFPNWVTRSWNYRVEWLGCYDSQNMPDALLARSRSELGRLMLIESERSLYCSKALQVREVDSEQERNDLALVMEMTGPRLIRIGNDDFHELTTFPDPVTLEGAPAPRPRNQKALRESVLLRLVKAEARMAEGLVVVRYIDVRTGNLPSPTSPLLVRPHYGLRRLGGEWLVPLGTNPIEAIEAGFLVWDDPIKRTQLRQLREPDGTLLATDIAAVDWRTADTTAGRRHLLRDVATGRWRLLDGTGKALTEAVFVDPQPSRFVLLDRIPLPSTPSADGAKLVTAAAFNLTIPRLEFPKMPRPDMAYRLFDPDGASLGRTLASCAYGSLDGTMIASLAGRAERHGLLAPSGEWLVEPSFEGVYVMEGSYDLIDTAIATIQKGVGDTWGIERQRRPAMRARVAGQRESFNPDMTVNMHTHVNTIRPGMDRLAEFYPEDRSARKKTRGLGDAFDLPRRTAQQADALNPSPTWYLVEHLQATGTPISLGPLVVRQDGKLGLIGIDQKRLILPIEFDRFVQVGDLILAARTAKAAKALTADFVSREHQLYGKSPLPGPWKKHDSQVRIPADCELYRIDGSRMVIPGLEGLGAIEGGYHTFTANGRMGLLDPQGEVRLPPIYLYVGPAPNCLSSLLVVEAPEGTPKPEDYERLPAFRELVEGTFASVNRHPGQARIAAFDTLTGQLSPMDCDAITFMDCYPPSEDPDPTFRILLCRDGRWQPMGPDGQPFGPATRPMRWRDPRWVPMESDDATYNAEARSLLAPASNDTMHLLEPPTWTTDATMPALLTVRGEPSVLRTECGNPEVAPSRINSRHWIVREPAPSDGVFYVDRFGKRLRHPDDKAE